MQLDRTFVPHFHFQGIGTCTNFPPFYLRMVNSQYRQFNLKWRYTHTIFPLFSGFHDPC